MTAIGDPYKGDWVYVIYSLEKTYPSVGVAGGKKLSKPGGMCMPSWGVVTGWPPGVSGGKGLNIGSGHYHFFFGLAFTPTTVFKPSLNHGKRHLTVSLLEVTLDRCCGSSKSPKVPETKKRKLLEGTEEKCPLIWGGSLLVYRTSNQLFNNVLHEKVNRMKLMCVWQCVQTWWACCKGQATPGSVLPRLEATRAWLGSHRWLWQLRQTEGVAGGRPWSPMREVGH